MSDFGGKADKSDRMYVSQVPTVPKRHHSGAKNLDSVSFLNARVSTRAT
jgi:hypothetical protein